MKEVNETELDHTRVQECGSLVEEVKKQDTDREIASSSFVAPSGRLEVLVFWFT